LYQFEFIRTENYYTLVQTKYFILNPIFILGNFVLGKN